jgi:hypothetical protein
MWTIPRQLPTCGSFPSELGFGSNRPCSDQREDTANHQRKNGICDSTERLARVWKLVEIADGDDLLR